MKHREGNRIYEEGRKGGGRGISPALLPSLLVFRCVHRAVVDACRSEARWPAVAPDLVQFEQAQERKRTKEPGQDVQEHEAGDHDEHEEHDQFEEEVHGSNGERPASPVGGQRSRPAGFGWGGCGSERRHGGTVEGENVQRSTLNFQRPKHALWPLGVER